ncbi:MAG: helix-turn-helix domain-containing protein [Candidatus Anstonellales archaeon]
MEKLKTTIAGEIALSETPGGTMKKWREIFGITQVELGETLGIRPSTISDYEGNRRKSPGTAIIKRFVDALIRIDKERGSPVASKLVDKKGREEEFYELHEFSTGVSASEFATKIKGEIVAAKEAAASKKIYGYTILDSIKVILEMPYTEFPKLYGRMSERAFIFKEVSTGRSPMVVIRVSSMKPSVVVLHELETVDKLAIKIAEREQIPLITTDMGINKIKERLGKL